MGYVKRNIFMAFAVGLGGLWLGQFVAPHIYILGYNLALHTLLEVLSILMAFSIFNVAWVMRAGLRNKQGRFILFFSLLFFAVGTADLLHALADEGRISFFAPGSYQKALFLWLFGRYLIVISFLAAFLSGKLTEKLRPGAIAITAFNSVIVLPVFLLSAFLANYVPPLFITNFGFAIHPRNLEYLLIALYLTSFYLLWRKQAFFKNTVFLQLCYFLILSFFSEIFFTFYINVSDTYNLFVHIYKVLSYYFLYRAVCLSGIADHFYTLSEMAEMSAELLNNNADIKPIMEIQLNKLRELIPQAERMVFYLHEENFIFRVAFSWGKYNDLTPVNIKLSLKEICAKLGDNISIINELPRKLTSLPIQEVPDELVDALKFMHQAMYIPLTADGIIFGFIMVYIFNPLRGFTEEDIEKATVFQKFASLSLAQSKHQEIIKKLSLEDSLTNLPNRRAFFEALKKAVYNATRYSIPYTVVSLDMNGLKYINDNLGHAAGDEALRLISQTLMNSVRQSDTTARLGGDEFGIIFTHMNLKDGQEKIDELKKIFSYLNLPAYNHSFSVAIGGASSPDEGNDEDTILKLADDRMYAHKHEYKSDTII